MAFGALAVTSLLVTIGCGVWGVIEFYQSTIVVSRNFYGVLRVQESGVAEGDRKRQLVHGNIMHGKQYLDRDLRTLPTSYYTATSGIGRVIEAMHPRRDPIKVGIIGLGAGTIAAYGSKGDVYRFYDINPGVIAIANRDFSYLKDSDATIELPLGDARLKLEREAPQGFDVLAIDAFSSDAIPVHLITKEAVQVYLKHMKPDGVIAYHVTNRYPRPGAGRRGHRARVGPDRAVDLRQRRRPAVQRVELGAARPDPARLSDPRLVERPRRSCRAAIGACGRTISTICSRY